MAKMRLSTFAYQVGVIQGAPVYSSFNLAPCEGLVVRVDIKEAYPDLSWDPGWDRVLVNGRDVGNRSGAVAEFVRLVCEMGVEVELS